MWTTIANGFKALLDNSPITLFLGVMVIVMSVVDVFIAKKNSRETTAKIVAAVISLALLFAQAKSSTKAAAQEATRLQDALNRQRDQLTSAFVTGTDQVIKATNQTAIQTQRSAKQQTGAIEKQAKQQTDDIKQQAAEQFTQLQTVMRGSSTCPIVQAGILQGPKIGQMTVSNSDPKWNMYDIQVLFTEYAPDQTSGYDENWNKVLQVQPVNFGMLPPRRFNAAPVTFLSKMTDIHVEYFVTTRAAICGGSFDLFDTGKNGWVIDRIFEYTGSTTVSNYNRHLSPGLTKSKPDPDSQ